MSSEEELGDEAREDGDSVEASEAAAVVTADLEQLSVERDELRSLAQRVQADFENYRKRVMRDQAELGDRATAALVEQLLPVLDTFELALANLGATDAGARKGVELVYSELVSVLERAGLGRVQTDDQPFDPTLHEAVMHDAGDGDPVVTETMRTGYRFKDKVLRPAMVRVGRAD